MKILLTGANGYIGSRLLPILASKGHTVFALVREPRRLHLEESVQKNVQVIQADLLQPTSLQRIPQEIDVAYYLVHSMAEPKEDFQRLDQNAARHFVERLNQTNCKQINYLSGIQDPHSASKHLASRKEVEGILKKAEAATTILRAAIIVGEGSASFEIMRDLVEKLPIMIAPKWVKRLCQPIAIRDVLYYLEGASLQEEMWNKCFDIGGPDILSYRMLLLEMARIRGLKRWIIQVPILSPRLSSYWLYLVTSTNFFLAKSLVASLKNDVVCQNSSIRHILPQPCLSYQEAVERAFDKIAQGGVVSRWTDAVSSGRMPIDFLDHVKPPKEGCVRLRFSKFFRKNHEAV